MKVGRVLPILFLCTMLYIVVPTVFIINYVENGDTLIGSTEKGMPNQEVHNAFRNRFYENVGQINNNDVLLYGKIPGGMIGFGISKVLLWIDSVESNVELSFEESSEVTPCGIDSADHHTNYFLGERGTFTNIESFYGIIYEDLWPGISLCYQARIEGTKYEFIVASNANPGDIRIRSIGHDKLRIEPKSISFVKDDATFFDEGLLVLQEKKEITASFIPLDFQTFSFEIESYDVSKELIIDPLLFSTYIGDFGYDMASSIALDSSSNIYVTGSTVSPGFPAVNAYNNTYGGNSDCFVFKLSADGSELLYSTFIGGSQEDRGRSIALDSSDNICVTGSTNSEDFPTVNAFNSTYSGHGDCFVFKLSADGSDLLYSTYIGGLKSDIVRSIALDSSDNICVTGSTNSEDFPILNAYNSTYGGQGDCFVLKLSADGSDLLYSTYIGGSESDIVSSIALDSSDNICVTGSTNSEDFPILDAYDSTFDGDENGMAIGDCFVFKLSADGSELLYSTYIGGFNADNGGSITLDKYDNIYVAGETYSENFPTVNAYSSTYSGQDDCFVFKLSADGSDLLYSTYIGGSDIDRVSSIALDSSSNVYVSGITYSENFPTVDAYDNTFEGGRFMIWGGDSFVFKLSANGSDLLYSTYIGGSESDIVSSIALDSSDNICVTGSTNSEDFPIVNAYNSTYGGQGDCFVFKLSCPEDTITKPKDWSAEILGIIFVAGVGIVVLLVTFYVVRMWK